MFHVGGVVFISASKFEELSRDFGGCSQAGWWDRGYENLIYDGTLFIRIGERPIINELRYKRLRSLIGERVSLDFDPKSIIGSCDKHPDFASWKVRGCRRRIRKVRRSGKPAWVINAKILDARRDIARYLGHGSVRSFEGVL